MEKKNLRNFLYENKITVPKMWSMGRELISLGIYVPFVISLCYSYITSGSSNIFVYLAIVLLFVFGNNFSGVLTSLERNYFYNEREAEVVNGKITPKPLNKTGAIVLLCFVSVMHIVGYLFFLIAFFANLLFWNFIPYFNGLTCFFGMLGMTGHLVLALVCFLRFMGLIKKYNNGLVSDEQMFFTFKVTPPKPAAPAPAQPESKSEAPDNAVFDQLAELKKMKDAGLITEEEYQAKKKELLKL